VHLAHIGYPVLCDRLYSGRAEITLGDIAKTKDETPILTRQALHARRIRLAHPATKEPIEFVAPIPEDLQRTIEVLRQYRAR
jgi:23S rRNA pseudouridine1911/1915/1917 synthase